MSDKRSPCPNCGGKVTFPESPLAEDGHDGWPTLHCYSSCGYSISANTKAQAIAHHERLAGRCRWKLKHDKSLGLSAWWGECGAKAVVSDDYCPNCGKKVEEVR
jgi:hypothetical protein